MSKDITAESRAAAVESLNQRLAARLSSFCRPSTRTWNVTGRSILALHRLFERVAVEVAGHTDLIAERAIQLGGVAEGGCRAGCGEALGAIALPITDQPRGRPREGLAGALAAFAAKMGCSIADVKEALDSVTVDLLTEISRDIEKLLWLVEAHAQPPR
jgi:starvation-inducible DNA-binding protein